MQDSKEIQVMRNMAIAKIIGELRGLLYSTYDSEYYKNYLEPNIKKAIELLEDCK